MPQYFFTVRAADGSASERVAELSDDTAAQAYAFEVARELSQGVALTDGGSLLKVRDEIRPMVFSIPLFPACA